jgi:chloramphenicol 3-O-phosphotransferase
MQHISIALRYSHAMGLLGCSVRAKKERREERKEERSERVIGWNVKGFIRHLEKETAGQPAAYSGSHLSTQLSYN